MFGTDDDPQMKKIGLGIKKFAIRLQLDSEDEFEIQTIYVDTRTEEEKLSPAFRYVFKRSE